MPTDTGNPDDGHVSRGAEAYRQAYEYIRMGNPDLPERRLRRTAWRYLLITASPPLTREQKRAARRARKIERSGVEQLGSSLGS